MSPRVLAKAVYAGTNNASFADAQENLAHVGDLNISDDRVRRACHRTGSDRIEHHQRLQDTFQAKTLPEQTTGKPAGAEPPEIACVMCDGGRYQHLDRSSPPKSTASARKGEHWKESRIGLLAKMSGESYDCDPQPELPPELRYDAMAPTLSEIGKTGAKRDSSEEEADDEDSELRTPSDGLAGPTLEGRSVVASRQCWEDFGPLLESQAWYQGFAAAKRQVFVSDGSSTIEKLQRKHFRRYTSVLDLLHALSYGLSAARAVSESEALAREQYDAWAEKIWQGRVDLVIAELGSHTTRLGEPPPDARSDDPREMIRMSRVYFENHRSRMDYPRYRRQGFPLTSSLMESTVKQVSRRVKGSEKYWSSAGGEAMLRLRGEYLSDDDPMQAHWETRSLRQNGTRSHKAQTLYN